MGLLNIHKGNEFVPGKLHVYVRKVHYVFCNHTERRHWVDITGNIKMG